MYEGILRLNDLHAYGKIRNPCKFNLRLQSYVHFHKSYHTHANLLGVKIPSYNALSNVLPGIWITLHTPAFSELQYLNNMAI